MEKLIKAFDNDVELLDNYGKLLDARPLTEEEYTAMDAAKGHLYNAVYSRFVSGLTRTMAEPLVALYYAYFGEKQIMHYSCGTCMYKVCRNVGALYYLEAERRMVAPVAPVVPKRRAKKAKEA